jgi:hypothetical protein
VPVSPRGASGGEGSFSVLAINQSAIFQVSQSEPDRDSTNIESPTEPMFAREGERLCFLAVENFPGESHDDLPASSCPMRL